MATPTPTIESFSFNSFFIIEIKNWQRATVSQYLSRACTVMSRCELLSLNHIIVWSNHINSYWALTMMVLTAAVGLLDALSDPLLRSDQPLEVSHQPRRSWHQRKFYSKQEISKNYFQNPPAYDLIQWIRFALCIDIDEIICNQKDQCSRHDSRKEANLHLRLLLHPHSSMLFLLRLPFRLVFSPIHTLDMERLNFGGPALENVFYSCSIILCYLAWYVW